MKKTGIRKLIALLLGAAMIVAVFTGCTIFEYDEEADMEQAIIDIAPVSYTYEVPLYEDYTDPYGRTVYEIDESGKTTSTPVSSVVRDHEGSPIHVPATNGAGEMLYVGYEISGGAMDMTARVDGGVTADDPRVYTETDGKNGDNHFIVFTANPSSSDVTRRYTATEYRFDGLKSDSGKYYALWTDVKDGSAAYGKVTVGSNTYTPSGELYVADLPTVIYKMTGSAPDTLRDVWSWTEYVHESATASGETERYSFYKQTVINYFDENGYTYYSENGYTIDEIFDEIIEQLYTSRIEVMEAEIAIKGGYVEWGVAERNDVSKTIYDGIDTALEQIYSQIADEFGLTYPSVSGDDSTTTTPDDSMDNYVVWHITQDAGRLIGKGATSEVRSMQRAGVRRFVDVVEEYIDNERALSAEDRKKYTDEVADMRSRINTPEGVDALYVDFGNYEVIRYMYGQSREYTLKTEGLREYISGENISEDMSAARAAFDEEVARQKEAYRADINTYYDEATGDTTILYYADSEIFWVKHILIPLSDEQKAALEAYKNAGHSDAEVKEYRRNLGMNVVAEKFDENGNATGETCTIQQAWSDIKSKMSALYNDPYAAANMFDELIATYNTDDGIKDNEKGYAVTATSELEGGREETYMIEFATEARALYKAYLAGMSLDEFKNSDGSDAYVTDPDFTAPSNIVGEGSISVPVMTDYGWHIMFLNIVPKVGQSLTFNSYLTPARKTTAGEAFIEDVTSKQEEFYNSWLATAANGYFKRDGVITVYKSRFSKYLSDYEDSFEAQQTADEEQEAAEAESESQTTTTA